MVSTEGKTGQPEQGQKGNPAETVIYINSAKRHVPNVEAHLIAIRSRLGLSQSEFAKRMKINRVSYVNVESNKSELVGSNVIGKVVEFIGENLQEDDPHAVAAVTLLSAFKLSIPERRRINDLIEDAQFTGKIKFTEDPKNQPQETEMSLYSSETEKYWYDLIDNNLFTDGFRALRAAENLSYSAFSRETGISRSPLVKMARDANIPKLPTVNKIIDTSPIDPRGKAAQLFRLKSQRKDAFDIRQLHTTDFGALVTYVRITQGLTGKQLAKILHRAPSTVFYIEKENRIPPGIAEEIARWLGDEPINEVIQRKIVNPKTRISKQLQSRVLAGRFLFVEPPLQAAA